jgi:alkylhydroperoxidase family enzyme
MNTRIVPLEAPFTAEVEAGFNTIMPPGMPPLSIFKTIAHNPRVLHRMIIGGLLDKSSIFLVDRELVILRTCGLCQAEYEWGVHVALFSAKAGFNEQQISDTARKQSDLTLWSPEQQLLIQLVDQLHDSHQVNDALWAGLSVVYPAEQLIELIMLAGQYHAISFVVNACQIERESFAPRFPEF